MSTPKLTPTEEVVMKPFKATMLCAAMRHLTQPKGSSLCGQTCVAMAAGVTLLRSIEVFGTRGGTRTKQVVAALRAFGFETVGDRLVRWDDKTAPPRHAILHLIWDKPGKKHKHGHWVLNWEGIVHDPALDTPGLYCGGRFVSYLEIIPRGSR